MSKRVAGDHLADGRRPAGDPNLLSEFLDEVADSASQSLAEPAVPGPFMTTVIERSGQEIGRRRWQLLSAAAGRWTVLLGRAIANEPTQPAVGRVRLTNPRDRLALLPPRMPRGRVDVTLAPPFAFRPNLESKTVPRVLADAYPTPWSAPLTLLERLEVLADHPHSAEWAHDTINAVQRLTAAEALSSDEMIARINRLQALAAQAATLADGVRDDRLRAELLRAHWGLARRLECWAVMREITIASAGVNRYATRVPAGSGSNGLAGQGTAAFDLHALGAELESYEQVRSPRLARAITERQRQLAESPDPNHRALAGQIEDHYRNSNIRVALSAELLSRYVSQPEPEIRPVHDRIAGTPVRGQSQTIAENRVRLEPTSGRWQVDLEAEGVVASNTVADGGQARLRSHGTTQFSAQKSIVVATDGVHVGRSAVNAESRNRLMGVRSDYDWLPIVGDIVRNVAVENYWKKQPRARAEVEYKVARRVEQQLDARTHDAVQQTEKEVQERLTGPLHEVGIELTPVELTTTTERVVARLRLAGNEQLGGHTPRPRAPGDSLASLQIHESAFSNAALSLDLDGQRMTAPELQQRLRERIPRLQEQPAMAAQEGTVFHFADRDAVAFRAAEGKLEIILSLAAVQLEGQVVRNFRVHANYRPVIRGLEAELVREGSLGIEGRLRTADRARMHGVFNKVLSEDRRIPMIRLTNPDDPRFDDLMITQLVLEDGWLGMAVGPTVEGRTAERRRTLR
jgi:hypothetical protein